MAITLYHPKHDNGDKDPSQPMLRHGRCFRPSPTPQMLAKLKASGWKESPHELPGYVHPPSAQDVPDFDLFLDDSEEDLDALLTGSEDDDKGQGTNAPPAVPKDIRTIPSQEAILVINTISDRKTLTRIQKRETNASRPRKSVLKAIAARLEDVG